MIKTPLISVVIPMYNCAVTIAETISSVLKQTYANYELLLVDDESSDSTVEVCKKTLLNYSNWKLIKQKNRGPSFARNHGIDEAHGEFIVFLDSDDRMASTMLEKLLKAQMITGSDMIVCGFTYVRISGNVVNIPQGYSGKFENIPDNIFYSCYFQKIFNAPWNKLFKKSIIDKYKLRYNTNISIFEDLLFSLEYMAQIDQIVIIPEALYYYNRLTVGGLLHKFNFNKDEAIFLAKNAMNKITDRISVSAIICKDLNMLFLKDIVWFQSDILKTKNMESLFKNKKIKQIRKMSEYRLMLRQSRLPSGAKDKILWLCIRFCPDLLIRMHKK